MNFDFVFIIHNGQVLKIDTNNSICYHEKSYNRKRSGLKTYILKECKDCKEDHVENCIINAIRNCYEVGLFGDVQPYGGSTLQYVMRPKSDFPDRSVQIAEAYRS